MITNNLTLYVLPSTQEFPCTWLEDILKARQEEDEFKLLLIIEALKLICLLRMAVKPFNELILTAPRSVHTHNMI